MYLYFLCRLLLSSFKRQNEGKKKKDRKPSPYTKFTGALSWKLIGLLTEMLKQQWDKIHPKKHTCIDSGNNLTLQIIIIMTMILLKIDGHTRSSMWHVTTPAVWNTEANFLSDVTMPSMNILILINWTKTGENDFYAAFGILQPLQMKREASPHCIFLNKKQRPSLINSRWLSFWYPGSR